MPCTYMHACALDGMKCSIAFGGKCLWLPIAAATPGEKRGSGANRLKIEHWCGVLIRPSPPVHSVPRVRKVADECNKELSCKKHSDRFQRRVGAVGG